MKAFQVYVPQYDNFGRSQSDAHAKLKNIALDIWGGYTILPGCTGAWRNPEDGILYLDTIQIWTLFAEDADTVRYFARCVAQDLDQLAVTVVFPDQSVEFVEQDTPIQ